MQYYRILYRYGTNVSWFVLYIGSRIYVFTFIYPKSKLINRLIIYLGIATPTLDFYIWQEEYHLPANAENLAKHQFERYQPHPSLIFWELFLVCQQSSERLRATIFISGSVISFLIRLPHLGWDKIYENTDKKMFIYSSGNSYSLFSLWENNWLNCKINLEVPLLVLSLEVRVELLKVRCHNEDFMLCWYFLIVFLVAGL